MKKKIKLVISTLLFCTLLVGTGKFFRYLLTDDTSSYTRITFHEMYEQDNIDVLFVGSSHCYRSFVPEIFDEKLGLNTFNGGTSAQNLDGSYMVIKEAARYNDIKHVYLELYYNISCSTPYKSRTELTQTYIISDYLRPSLDKIKYMLNASSKAYYSNSFIVSRRNWTRLFDADYVKNLLSKKNSDAYKNYEYTYLSNDSDWYAGKGYATSNDRVEDWNYFTDRGWGDIPLDHISDDWFHTLEDIIAFCRQKDIDLTLISAPLPDYLLASTNNYDEYIALVQNTIAGTGISYYDFNLCKKEFFPNTSSVFEDDHHLNSYGSEAFSLLLADFIRKEIPEDELFYGSYKEKLADMEPTVFGVSYRDSTNENGDPVRDCKIISTGNDNLEYSILLHPSQESSFRIQDFSNNSFFTILPEEHGTIVITYRLSDLPDSTKTCNITY